MAVAFLHTCVVCCSVSNLEMLCEGLAQTDSFLLDNQVNQLPIKHY